VNSLNSLPDGEWSEFQLTPSTGGHSATMPESTTQPP
jgi:hypothetical protein